MAIDEPIMADAPQTRLGRIFRWLDDGRLLRITFNVMLVATVCVIAVDYLEQSARDGTALQYEPSDRPILPSVERPELDPNDPALRPTTEITTPPEQLAEPLTLTLTSNGVLHLDGTIVPGAAEQLLTELALRGEYITTIALNSPGGIVQEALIMGQLIRDGGYATSVGAGQLCASSCPLVLAGGVTRTLDAKAVVGVHQIYQSLEDVRDPRNNPAQAMSDAQALTAGIGRFLDEMGIDPRLWFHALETPPDKLYYLTHEQMDEFGLSYLPPLED